MSSSPCFLASTAVTLSSSPSPRSVRWRNGSTLACSSRGGRSCGGCGGVGSSSAGGLVAKLRS
eukprot:1881069-Pyramimonas_sp.AAC.1